MLKIHPLLMHLSIINYFSISVVIPVVKKGMTIYWWKESMLPGLYIHHVFFLIKS